MIRTVFVASMSFVLTAGLFAERPNNLAMGFACASGDVFALVNMRNLDLGQKGDAKIEVYRMPVDLKGLSSGAQISGLSRMGSYYTYYIEGKIYSAKFKNFDASKRKIKEMIAGDEYVLSVISEGSLIPFKFEQKLGEIHYTAFDTAFGMDFKMNELSLHVPELGIEFTENNCR